MSVPYVLRWYQFDEVASEINSKTRLWCSAVLTKYGAVPFSLISLKQQRCYKPICEYRTVPERPSRNEELNKEMRNRQGQLLAPGQFPPQIKPNEPTGLLYTIKQGTMKMFYFIFLLCDEFFETFTLVENPIDLLFLLTLILSAGESALWYPSLRD